LNSKKEKMNLSVRIWTQKISKKRKVILLKKVLIQPGTAIP